MRRASGPWGRLRCWLRRLWRGGLLRCHHALLIVATVRHARSDVAKQSFGLNVARPLVVTSALDLRRRRAIPRIERVSVMLSHLLFGRKTFAELVKYQIGVDRRHTAYQDHKHPFHILRSLRSRPKSGTARGRVSSRLARAIAILSRSDIWIPRSEQLAHCDSICANAGPGWGERPMALHAKAGLFYFAWGCFRDSCPWHREMTQKKARSRGTRSRGPFP